MRSYSYSFAPALLAALASATAGCQRGDDGAGARDSQATSTAERGSLHVAITAGALRHDVTAIHVKVVGAGSTCEAPAIAEATSELEADDLPGSVLPPGSGPHAGAGGLFVLPSGDYRVCVTPLALGAPSLACASIEGQVSVSASATTETLLAPSCGAGDGGLDVVVALNDPPRISALDVAPSKFISQCETATITTAAQDPDGDPISFGWLVTAAPAGALANLSVNGPVAQFSTDSPGDYQLQLVATDVYSASTFLNFPLHVSAANCGSAPSCRGDDGTLFCGGSSPDGCFCDDLCAQFGDCCPDKFAICGGAGGSAGSGGAGGGAGSGAGAAGSSADSAGAPGAGQGGAAGAAEPDYDEVCATTADTTYHTSVGKMLEVSPLDNGTVGDDDWYVNAWVAGVESSNSYAEGTVAFEIPTDCPGVSGSPTPEGSTGGPTLAYTPSRLEPYEPFGFSRYYTTLTGQGLHSPLPKIKFSANAPGRYTVRYLLRNARQSRVVGRFFVEVGTWRGIWRYQETRERYTAGAGTIWCCDMYEPHTGTGCGERTTDTISYAYLDLGGDLAPRPVKAGVQRVGDRAGCPTGSTTEPPDAEVFSLKAVNYFGISSGAGADQYVGALLCTGFDTGLPGNSWVACAAQATPSPPGNHTCIPDTTCF